ncbi:hypothetical protein ACP4OV_029102 [Aristida adscensionis]
MAGGRLVHRPRSGPRTDAQRASERPRELGSILRLPPAPPPAPRRPQAPPPSPSKKAR